MMAACSPYCFHFSCLTEEESAEADGYERFPCKLLLPGQGKAAACAVHVIHYILPSEFHIT